MDSLQGNGIFIVLGRSRLTIVPQFYKQKLGKTGSLVFWDKKNVGKTNQKKNAITKTKLHEDDVYDLAGLLTTREETTLLRARRNR